MVLEVEVRPKKWGNSLGILLPKRTVETGRIKESKKLKILILDEELTAEPIFGMLKGKWKKSTQQIKDELREELYDD